MCKVAKSCLLLVIPSTVFALAAQAGPYGEPWIILYVDDSATGANDGSKWLDAFTDLQSAVDVASGHGGIGVEIRVAQGIYKPSKRTVEDDPRSTTFTLPDGVILKGGYAGGTKGDLNDYSYVTILSGDLLGDDQPPYSARGDNVYHVVTVPTVTVLPTLDRVAVRGGFTSAFGGGVLAQNGVQLSRCSFEGNIAGMPFDSGEGSVAHVQGGAAVAIMAREESGTAIDMCWEDCSFWDNVSSGTGGAIFAAYGNITMTGCHFYENVGGAGGAIGAEWLGRLELHDCHFGRNRTGESYYYAGGGAIMVFYDMDSLDISNCTFGFNEGEYGGAIHVPHVAGYVSLRDSLFEWNRASHVGGAFTGSMAVLDIQSCEFENNHSQFGGAISLSTYSPTLIQDCQFLGNSASIAGGAINNEGSDLVIRASSFDSNVASEYGGGVFTEGSTVIKQSAFTLNGASRGGGAVFIRAYGARGDIVDSTFVNNAAAIGGGIYGSGGPLLIDRCEVRNNGANTGGGLFLDNRDGPALIRSSLLVKNSAFYGGAIAGGVGAVSIEQSTIVHNRAEVLGAALIGAAGTSVRNSIVWYNYLNIPGDDYNDEHAQIEGLESVDVSFSAIQNWTGTIGEASNTPVDPWFIDGDEINETGSPASGNYRLRVESSIRNSGDPEFYAEYGLADLDGHARVLCGRVDMGAYESGFGDGDCDGVVNAWDFAVWSACAQGEMEGESCAAMDSDVDGDFDLKDFAAIQNLQ